MSGLKLLVFLSSVREPRNADRVLKLVSKLAEERGFVVDVIDPLKENLPMVKTPLHYYPDQSKAPKQLHVLNQKILFADSFLMLSAEYNSGVPPALKNTLDHFSPVSFGFKPAGIITYSAGNGGKVCCAHLENSLIYMGCLVQPFTVCIPTVQNAITEDGVAQGGHLEENINILLDQIEFTGLAMKQQKQSGKTKVPRVNNMY